MLFNSTEFVFFLPVVFVVYWGMQKFCLRLQNLFLLLASYVFYGFWDWRFLSVIFFSSAVDYFLGLGMGKTDSESRRRLLLRISLLFNLGLLGFFKYFGFFIENLRDLLSTIGLNINYGTLSIILPVGISFFTFKKMSYCIDIYRGRLEPVKDAPAFFAFVAFFPQLMAGPIDRASTLLPQFMNKREFSDSAARDGLRQMLSGFMKKLIIADRLAPMVNIILANHFQYDGVTLLLGIFFLAIQLYCDFSGYSDIAIGCGRLLGFNQMQNFAVPYFSRDIAEFWRRWHISLSSWLRDYLYMPLCGLHPSRFRKSIATVSTFTLCGLWHGASWTYVFWGFLHGLLFLPLVLVKRHPRYIGTPAKDRLLPSFSETLAIIKTFTMTSIAWVFFVSSSFWQALGIFSGIVTRPFLNMDYTKYLPWLFACLVLMVLEWLQREKTHFLQIEGLPVVLRWIVYLLSVVLILIFGAFGSSRFIYFQF